MSENPRLDAVIWANLGSKSAREIAGLAGATNEEVLARKKELLEEVDVLTVDQARMVLIAKLQDISNEALKKSKAVLDERNYAPILTAANGAIKTVLNEMRNAEKADRSAIDTLNSLRLKELLRLIDVVVTRFIETVSKEHDLDSEPLYELVQVLLMEAASEMELEA